MSLLNLGITTLVALGITEYILFFLWYQERVYDMEQRWKRSDLRRSALGLETS